MINILCHKIWIRLLSIGFVLVLVTPGHAQRVDVLKQSTLYHLPEADVFSIIEPNTDTSQIRFVARIEARDKMKKANIQSLYYDIRGIATNMGANCFKVRSYTTGGARNETIMTLDCYVAGQSTIKQNIENREKNVVYIFGIERKDGRSTSFELNRERVELSPGMYYKLILEPGDRVKIRKGGFFGSSVVLRGKENRKPVFLSLSGVGFSPVDSGPVIGISVTSGKVERIENNSVGLLLSRLLDQADTIN